MKLNALGRLIFLDRYAKKDMSKKVEPGDTVVVYVDPESKQRELAYVWKVSAGEVEVNLEKGGAITIPLNQIDRPVESLEEAHLRMASALAHPEAEPMQVYWTNKFHEELYNGRFVPAGRIWAGAGVEEKLTPYNCYVLPPPKDSRAGINTTEGQMVEIMCRGGGVGIPIHTLRPKHALVRGVNGRSSGSVMWAESFSHKTGLVEQGGSRRGALIVIQAIWHPDVIEFIHAKKKSGRLENANISVAITDPFMQAIAEGANWDLKFPDTTHPAYDLEWDGDIVAWEEKNYPVNVYKTLPARELWDMIVHSAWASAEPGLLFVDRYNKMSNTWYYPEGKIWCTNPCGEQGLPSWGVCNLGHLNLSQFLDGDGMGAAPATVNYEKLRRAIRNVVRFMDNVIDVAYAPFDQNKKQQIMERRVGLGTMGLAEAMIRCHVRYGRNDECFKFIDEAYKFIAVEAYLASVELAKEKGSFEKFDADKFLNSGFMRGMPGVVCKAINEYGIRNATLLTQAPTGTVGSMMGTSTGIEPYYAWEWERFGRLGTHSERANVYAEYLEKNPEVAKLRASLPDSERYTSSKYLPQWFVSATELTPEDHAYTQSWIQRWVDASISKTSNLPQDYTPEQVGAYYELLYKLGCKGGTVYRDKSRETQVLNTPVAAANDVAEKYELRPVPTDVYDGKFVHVHSPIGKLSLKLGVDDEGQPFEAWIDVSRAGTAVKASSEGIARLMSLVLRMESSIKPRRRLELMAGQLAGIGGGDSVGFGPEKVLSIPDSIAKALNKHLTKMDEKEEPDDKGKVVSVTLDVCPQCHGTTLRRTEGCTSCSSCGYSKC